MQDRNPETATWKKRNHQYRKEEALYPDSMLTIGCTEQFKSTNTSALLDLQHETGPPPRGGHPTNATATVTPPLPPHAVIS